MKITRINNPFPAVSIDDFIPSEAMVRAASKSFDDIKFHNSLNPSNLFLTKLI